MRKRAKRLTIGSAVSSSTVSERDMTLVSTSLSRFPTNRLTGMKTSTIQMPHTHLPGWAPYGTKTPSGFSFPRMGIHSPAIRHAAHATTVSRTTWRSIRTN